MAYDLGFKYPQHLQNSLNKKWDIRRLSTNLSIRQVDRPPKQGVGISAKVLETLGFLHFKT